MYRTASILHLTDQEIRKLKHLEDLNLPPAGWIRTIRKSLGMSLRQLGDRMGITPQSVKEIEDRERNGTVSIRVLQQCGRALGMTFVYGLVPAEQSLEAMIDKRIKEIAGELVYRASLEMRTGEKDPDPDRLLQAFIEKTRELKATMPVNLWDK